MHARAAHIAHATSRFWVVVAHVLVWSVMFSACSVASTIEPDRITTLVEVIDGDTVIIRFPNGEQETVRLLGIDTPETVDPTRPVQCFGREASEHLAKLLPVGTPLRLERDVDARDRFGRLLAYLYRTSDDLFVNVEMLRLGLADVSLFEPNTAHRTALIHAVTSARTGSIGLWEACGGPDVPLDPDEYN